MGGGLIQVLALTACAAVLIFGKAGLLIALPLIVASGWFGWRDGGE